MTTQTTPSPNLSNVLNSSPFAFLAQPSSHSVEPRDLGAHRAEGIARYKVRASGVANRNRDIEARNRRVAYGTIQAEQGRSKLGLTGGSRCGHSHGVADVLQRVGVVRA